MNKDIINELIENKKNELFYSFEKQEETWMNDVSEISSRYYDDDIVAKDLMNNKTAKDIYIQAHAEKELEGYIKGLNDALLLMSSKIKGNITYEEIQ